MNPGPPMNANPETDTETETDPPPPRDEGGSPVSESPAPALDDRRLCPDGSCVGILDARGVCKECGRSIAEP